MILALIKLINIIENYSKIKHYNKEQQKWDLDFLGEKNWKKKKMMKICENLKMKKKKVFEERSLPLVAVGSKSSAFGFEECSTRKAEKANSYIATQSLSACKTNNNEY